MIILRSLGKTLRSSPSVVLRRRKNQSLEKQTLRDLGMVLKCERIKKEGVKNDESI